MAEVIERENYFIEGAERPLAKTEQEDPYMLDDDDEEESLEALDAISAYRPDAIPDLSAGDVDLSSGRIPGAHIQVEAKPISPALVDSLLRVQNSRARRSRAQYRFRGVQPLSTSLITAKQALRLSEKNCLAKVTK